MLNTALGACLQLGAVLLICGLFWLPVKAKAEHPFLKFIGLSPSPLLALLIGAVLGAAGSAGLLMVPSMAALAGSSGTVVGEAAKGGVTPEILAGLVIAAVIKTALSEELLFRGLIGKRLYRWWGFWPGNMVQAGLFGAVHLLLLLLPAMKPEIVYVFVGFATAMALISGVLNEKMGKGSILPGWAMHAAANLVSYLCLALGVFGA